MPIGFWVMIGAMAFLILLYGVKIGFDPIIKRFLKVGAHLGESDSRLDIWRDSLAILKDHPLGIGLGNFRDVYPVYNVSRISDTRFLYAHNDYLHLLVEAGIPGFLALVSGFFVFLGKSIKKVKQMKPHYDPLRFFLAVGALGGLFSIAFHSFFDFNLHMPANLIYFVTLMAIVYSCAWREAPRRSSRRKAEGSKVKLNRAESSRLNAQSKISHRPTRTHTNSNNCGPVFAKGSAAAGPTKTYTNYKTADRAVAKMSSRRKTNKQSSSQRKYRSK
jgi:hypothetical protein